MKSDLAKTDKSVKKASKMYFLGSKNKNVSGLSFVQLKNERQSVDNALDFKNLVKTILQTGMTKLKCKNSIKF